MEKIRLHKKIISVICCIFLFALSGCSSKENLLQAKSYKKGNIELLDSTVVAENEKYSLSWDNENCCVSFKDLATGKVWSTTPQEYLISGNKSEDSEQMLRSPIYIEYFQGTVSNISSVYGYSGSVANNDFSAEKIKNGIRVTYYFEEYSVCVPVDYVLNKDSLSVSVDPKNVMEGDKKLYSISIAPFMCSVENNANNYLLVPSGSGALMYADEREDQTRSFSDMIYGYDRITEQKSKITNVEEIKLPVFGAKTGDNAILAIVDGGDELASVSASAGDVRCGYSSAYSTFYFRGFDKTIKNTDRSSASIKQIVNTADSIRKNKFSVSYFTLSGKDANYIGMAKLYRNYLLKKYDVSNKKIDASILNVNFIGGIQAEKNLIGIPYNIISTLTDYNDAQTITSDLMDDLDVVPTLTMIGYGKYGIGVDKLKNGFDFCSKIGSKSQIDGFMDCMSKKSVNVSFAYDTIHFKSSEWGVSTFFDAAKMTSGMTSTQYPISFALRSVDKDDQCYYLLSRGMWNDVSSDLLKKVEDCNIKNVDFLTLGNNAYSDYGNEEYYARSGICDSTKKIIESYQKKGIKISTHDSNSYAAICSDKVLEAPVFSAKFDSFDCDVPFYQAVFRGVTDLVGPAINETDNTVNTFLSDIESGSGLSFTFIGKYSPDLATNADYAFFSSLYDDNKAMVSEMVSKSKAYYDSINNSKIVAHKILENNVRKTVFENGTYVLVNYNNYDVKAENSLIKANDFVFGKE